MKVKMTSGYGDIADHTFVDFADDAEAQRLIDLKAARAVTDDENKIETFLKVKAAVAATKAPTI